MHAYEDTDRVYTKWIGTETAIANAHCLLCCFQHRAGRQHYNEINSEGTCQVSVSLSKNGSHYMWFVFQPSLKHEHVPEVMLPIHPTGQVFKP